MLEDIDLVRSHLLAWFEHNGRDFPWRTPDVDTYGKVIAEILLQRTGADRVAAIFDDFLTAFPDWNAIGASSTDRLETALKPLGLWKRRAQSLSLLAGEMSRRNGALPDTYEEVSQLPGVGQYIANAISLVCHGERYPLLDANMARILERYFGPRIKADLRTDPHLQGLSRDLVSKGPPLEVNWAVLDFAAAVCKPRKPVCSECGLSSSCRFARKDHQGDKGE